MPGPTGFKRAAAGAVIAGYILGAFIGEAADSDGTFGGLASVESQQAGMTGAAIGLGIVVIFALSDDFLKGAQ